MPSNKTFVTLILCAGIVLSVWLILRPTPTPAELVVQNNPTNTVSVESLRNIQNPNDDWEKMLSVIDPKNDKIAKPIAENDSTYNDTTLTGQMARDFFSQYLILKKTGATITAEDVQKITDNTLSLPQYTQTTGAVYTSANLQLIQKTDTTTVQKYYSSMVAIFQKLPKDDTDPAQVVKDAMAKNDEKLLIKIDPLITAGKSTISDLLRVPVPSDAVTIHLALLNAGSNMLTNLEGMRATFTDPVKSFAGTGQYAQHLRDFQDAVVSMQKYFAQKLGTKN